MSFLDNLLRHESIPLYTQNVTYFVERKSKWLRDYTNIYYTGTIGGAVGRHPPIPPYDDELLVMATVSAYFEVASQVNYFCTIYDL